MAVNTTAALHLTPDDYRVIRPGDFGAPGLVARESIGPFVEIQALGPLVTVHDSTFEPHTVLHPGVPDGPAAGDRRVRRHPRRRGGAARARPRRGDQAGGRARREAPARRHPRVRRHGHAGGTALDVRLGPDESGLLFVVDGSVAVSRGGPATLAAEHTLALPPAPEPRTVHVEAREASRVLHAVMGPGFGLRRRDG